MRSVRKANVQESAAVEIMTMSRRAVLVRGAIVAAGMSLPSAVSALTIEGKPQPNSEITKGESMSHHLDSPIARQDLRLDITDLYVFRGEVGTAFVINVCHSIGQPPISGYHPEGMYEFKIDHNGDAVEEVTYRFTFKERDSEGKQKYTIHRIHGKDAVDPHAQGTVVAQGETEETVSTPEGVRAWAGHAGDPFWIEPDVLHAVGHAFEDGTKVDLTGWDPSKAHNLFAGHTVYAIVLEIPDSVLLANARDNHKIGVWAVSTLATDAGGWRSVNRIGLPMMPPLFAQYDEQFGNSLNAGHPSEDFATYGSHIIKSISSVVAAYGTAEDPHAYAEKIAHRMLPNVLPYTVGTQASLGFVEWNGRSLTDHAPNVMFSTAANAPIQLGIGKESVTSKPRKSFPYVPVVL
ncbi:DUF4331 family protein [Granulicella sp. WH15]|uniref:DUF4331 family protein n=1 Tax=Granulicella sp. WH15 TaxID=2602070 RepID=UPI00210312E5|nr:DUF4331 family protein [Granulicella sp. WH15]